MTVCICGYHFEQKCCPECDMHEKLIERLWIEWEEQEIKRAFLSHLKKYKITLCNNKIIWENI